MSDLGKESNDILTFSKPKYSVVKELLDSLEGYKEQITLRFTIISMNNQAINYWEPNAPIYEERYESLKYAYNEGWETSVSIEPVIFTDTVQLVHNIYDYITDSIWIGMMNGKEQQWEPAGDDRDIYYGSIVDNIKKEENIEKLYEQLKDLEKVHWKDSIKEVMDLEAEPVG